MPDILLDANGDIDLTGNTMTLANTAQEARQQVFITLNTYKGEWDFNIVFGIPYLANDNNNIQILGIANKDIADAYLKQGVLNNSLVSELNQYNSTLNKSDRSLTVSFTAVLQDGSELSSTEVLAL